MANFTLTAGVDAVAGGAVDDTVYATAATLNGSNIINGDASYPFATTLSFFNNQGVFPPPPVT